MHPSHIMTQREIIRNILKKSDWEITKDKCDSTRAHRRHLAANRKHENKRKIYCTNVHLRIIEILIKLMYKLSAVTAAVTLPLWKHTPVCLAGSSEVKEMAKVTKNRLIYDKM